MQYFAATSYSNTLVKAETYHYISDMLLYFVAILVDGLGPHIV